MVVGDSDPRTVATKHGPAVAHCGLPGGVPRCLLVLGHGAGGGVDAPDLLAVRAAALARGAVVALVEQPYRVAGRRAPAPAAQLDEAWATVCADLCGAFRGLPLVTGGRSSGARVACRTAKPTGARGVLALAFPRRPPRTPDRDRTPELIGAGVPILCVSGDRDPFGIPDATKAVQVVVIPGADHALRRDPAAVADAVVRWLARRRLLAPPR